jgi:integrase
MAVRYSVKLRKKPDRDSYLLYYVDPISKREVSRSAKTTDKREAERAAALWEQELVQYNGVDGSGWQAFRDRFDDEKLAFLAVKSRAAYTTALNAFAQRCPVTSLKQVDASLISKFAAMLSREDYPHATIKNYLTHLQAALRWAERMGLIRKAPTFNMPPGGKRAHMRGRPLTSRELGRMLRACRQLHPRDFREWRRLVKLLWLTGLRLGEALELSWQDPPLTVNLDAKPYPLLVIQSEGQKSRHDTAVPLAPDAAAWLGRVDPELRKGLVVDVRNSVGNRYSAEKLSDEICQIGKHAKVITSENGKDVKYASAHDLRRSFGTRWALRVKPLTLQKMMRHTDLSTTLRFYIHLSSSDVGADLWKS